MTKDEALRLALEALETHVPHFYKDRGYAPIDTIKQALEQPEPDQPARRQEPLAKRLMDCNDCGGSGVDGDVDNRGRTIDVQCRSCAGSGKSRYLERCVDGGRCLQGCLGTDGCYWEKRAAKEQPAQQREPEPVAVVDANDEGYWADILPDRSVKVGQLLYTYPPQRKPLTDEQVEKMWGEESSCDMPDNLAQFKHTIRVAEAAHGIKGKA